MLAIGSSYYVAGGSAPVYAQPGQTAARQGGSSPDASAATSDEASLTLTRHDLLELNGAVGQSSQVSNALATANDALDVIGGLLGNVGAVLAAARSPDDTGFDPATDQNRIDSAVVTIDAVASSARFGGRNLLDGSFDVPSKSGTARLPSFASKDLGTGSDSRQTESITSLTTGGANDLSSGRLDVASRIVASAMSQVTVAHETIDVMNRSAGTSSQVELPAPPTGVAPTDLMASAAREMLSDPTLSTIAVANSDGRRVLALLQP